MKRDEEVIQETRQLIESRIEQILDVMRQGPIENSMSDQAAEVLWQLAKVMATVSCDPKHANQHLNECFVQIAMQTGGVSREQIYGFAERVQAMNRGEPLQ